MTLIIIDSITSNTLMFAKAWNYFLQQYHKYTQPPQDQPVLIPYHQPPSLNPPPPHHPQPKYSLIQQQSSSPSPAFEIRVDNDEELKEKMKNDEEELQYTHQVIEEVRELEERVRRMTIQEKSLQQAQSRVWVYEHQKLAEERQPPTSKQSEIRQRYYEEVVEFRGCKYSKERKDYPRISYEVFREVCINWRSNRRSEAEIKATSLDSVKKLTYKSFGTLDQGMWLNDEIVSIYVELLDKEVAKDTQYKVLNSFFAPTTLNKEAKMIDRAIKKKNITKDKSLILPINHDNKHWYFVKIEPNAMVVYDSLVGSKDASWYLKNQIISNIHKFGNRLYEAEMQVSVCSDFPQQFNGVDCGVFMLAGIRDLLRGVQWTFRQGDISFKRVQLACQIWKEKLLVGSDSETEEESA